jgi:hypothetical protein
MKKIIYNDKGRKKVKGGGGIFATLALMVAFGFGVIVAPSTASADYQMASVGQQQGVQNSADCVPCHAVQTQADASLDGTVAYADPGAGSETKMIGTAKQTPAQVLASSKMIGVAKQTVAPVLASAVYDDSSGAYTVALAESPVGMILASTMKMTYASSVSPHLFTEGGTQLAGSDPPNFRPVFS